MQNIHLVRELILDQKQKVLGYRLAWHGLSEDGSESEYLAAFIAEQLNDEDEGWLMGDKLLFLDAVPALLTSDILQNLPPKNIVLRLAIEELDDATTAANVKALRAQGFGISVRVDHSSAQKIKAVSDVNFVEVQFTAGDVVTQAKEYFLQKPSSARMIGRPVATWQEFDVCTALGMDVYIGELYLSPRPGAQAMGLNPSQAIILKLMEMIQKNDNIQKIEGVLKRDPAISYKLLRFINSAAFGLSREIQSLRQALALLGYAPLYRWLSMLLATASTSGYSPVLMETAIIRGRFAELLGGTVLPKTDADNLFIAGMFSLLDRLLGVSIAEVLSTIPLPKAIEEALLTRSGMYGPYLALAEACELNSASIGALADSLDLRPQAVNMAHIAALEWAQNLGM